MSQTSVACYAKDETIKQRWYSQIASLIPIKQDNVNTLVLLVSVFPHCGDFTLHILSGMELTDTVYKQQDVVGVLYHWSVITNIFCNVTNNLYWQSTKSCIIITNVITLTGSITWYRKQSGIQVYYPTLVTCYGILKPNHYKWH